jgi:hypothetical protein
LGCPARYLAPFYPLLVAPLLAGTAVAGLVRHKKPWAWAGAIIFLLAALLLVVSPSRPLWPASTVLRALGADNSSRPLVRRAWTVYHVYGERADAFAPALEALPPGTQVVGLVTADDPETSLWRPFGSRRLVHVTCADSPEQNRQRGVKYLLVSSPALTQHCGLALDDWLREKQMTLIRRLSLELRAEKGPVDWYLVQQNPGPISLQNR